MNILKILTDRRKIGNIGERAAARHLRKSGYRIIKKNYSAADAEIDIIASKSDILAFIEVKARNIKNLGSFEARPASAVTPEKQRKIIRTASCYLSRYHNNERVRFDVIEVYLEDAARGVKIKEIKHLTDAFNKNTAYSKGRA